MTALNIPAKLCYFSFFLLYHLTWCYVRPWLMCEIRINLLLVYGVKRGFRVFAKYAQYTSVDKNSRPIHDFVKQLQKPFSFIEIWVESKLKYTKNS